MDGTTHDPSAEPVGLTCQKEKEVLSSRGAFPSSANSGQRKPLQ